MQQQLKRIKNKDLSQLDDKLFGSLDKVQTINSTIDNLAHFQKFLLQQINKFQEKAKHKTHDQQVNQVIQQNCLTLRQSILKVVPQIQSSTSRLRQSILSPINGFRSTGFQMWRNSKKGQNKQQRKRIEQNIEIRQEGSVQLREKILQRVQEVRRQIKEIKVSQEDIRIGLHQMNLKLKKQIQSKIKSQLNSVYAENKILKQEILTYKQLIDKLEVQNKTVLEQIGRLRKQRQQFQGNRKKEQYNEKQLYLPINVLKSRANNQQDLSGIKLKQSNLYKGDQINNTKLNIKDESKSRINDLINNHKLSHEGQKQTPVAQHNENIHQSKRQDKTKTNKQTKNQNLQPKSFMDKMRTDFTSKLLKFYQQQTLNTSKILSTKNTQNKLQNKNTQNKLQSKNTQNKLQDKNTQNRKQKPIQSVLTDRESYRMDGDNKGQRKREQNHSGFRSVEIKREEKEQKDPNIPIILRRNSITHQYHNSNLSQQSLNTTLKLPLHQLNTQIFSNKQSLSLYHHNKQPSLSLNNKQPSLSQHYRQPSLSQHHRQPSFSFLNTHSLNNQQLYKHSQSTSKKSNHNLMRKTKSNFFKIPLQNKQNCYLSSTQPKLSLYEATLLKTQQLPFNKDEKKRRSQSKQKLKIFSII